MAPPSFDRPKTTRVEQPSVGHVLRARREELGWEIDAVAEWLRIRARMLVALESDDLKAFPGTAYAVGFLRTYARALDLDAEELVARYRQQSHGAVVRKPELVFPQPQDDRGVPVGVLIGAGLVVVVAAYAGWYRFANHDVPAERRVPAVAELMPGAATPLTTSPQVASVMPGQAPVPRTDDHPPVASSSAAAARTVGTPPMAAGQLPTARPPVDGVPADRTPDAASGSSGTGTATGNGTGVPTAGTAAPVSPPSVPAGSGLAGAASTLPSATVPTPIVPEKPVADGRIGVHAQASVWTQIRDQSGHVVLSRVLQPGETWLGEVAGAPYTMTFGNAGGVVLTLDGTTTAPLGREGSVRRNVVVSADAIRSGTFGTGPALPTPPSVATPTVVSPTPASPAVVSPAGTVVSGGVQPENARPGWHTAIRPRVSSRGAPASTGHASAEPTTDELNARQLERSAAPH